MHWITIVGLVVIAVGTWMTIHGQRVESKRESNASQSKIESKLVQIANDVTHLRTDLNEDPTTQPRDAEKRLDEIETNAKSIAKSLGIDLESLRARYDNKSAEKTARDIQESLKIVTAYDAVCDEFNKKFSALAAAHDSIEFTKFARVPRNLFDVDKLMVLSRCTFASGISTYMTLHAGNGSPPLLVISLASADISGDINIYLDHASPDKFRSNSYILAMLKITSEAPITLSSTYDFDENIIWIIGMHGDFARYQGSELMRLHDNVEEINESSVKLIDDWLEFFAGNIES